MELDVTTTIAEATVYPERALVARRGSVAIPEPGVHTLRVAGLPRAFQGGSLRATGRGPAGTLILGIEEAVEYYPAAPEETLARLRDEIERLTQEIALLDERLHTLDDQRQWLRTLGEQATRRIANGIAAGTSRPEDAGNVFAYTAQETERLAATRQEAQRRRQDVERERDARQREYLELGGGKRADRLSALVRVEVATAGEVELDVSYLVHGASWRPRYDARVDTEAARVRLTQQALVSQSTGEDWRDVALALSTARPLAARTLPDEPDPWYIDVRRPPEPKVYAQARGLARMAPMASTGPLAAPAGAAAADVAEQAAYSLGAVEAELATSEVERSGAAQVFRIPGDTSVPSDGQPHTLGLADDDLPCRLEYVAMPAIAPGAHLRAVTTNTTGGVLMRGDLHVFHAGAAGDEYVGATSLEPTAPGAELKLYLGQDDNVTVKRELVERDTDKASILQGGVRRITCGYRVTLGNRTGSPQRVVLMDRLPVPRHERVKLKVLDLRPQPGGHTKLEQLTWELQLAPGQEVRVEWRFQIESPADLDLTGLP